MNKKYEDQYFTLKVTLVAETIDPNPDAEYGKTAVSCIIHEYIDKPSEEIFTKLCNDVVWFLTNHESCHITNDERAEFMNSRRREIIASLNLDINDYKSAE